MNKTKSLDEEGGGGGGEMALWKLFFLHQSDQTKTLSCFAE